MITLTVKIRVWILEKVVEVSNGHRNPDAPENKRQVGKMGGKLCSAAAAPRDLGATKHDQTITEQMRLMCEEGLLNGPPKGRFSAPMFRVTPQGLTYIKEHKEPVSK